MAPDLEDQEDRHDTTEIDQEAVNPTDIDNDPIFIRDDSVPQPKVEQRGS